MNKLSKTLSIALALSFLTVYCDIFNPTPTHTLQTYSLGALLSPDGRFILTQDVSGKKLVIKDMANQDIIKQFDVDSRIDGRAFSLDNHYIAVEVNKTIFIKPIFTTEQEIALNAPDRIASLAWSPDNKYLATGFANGTIYIWNVKTGSALAQLGRQQEFASVSSLAFSPDGRYLASGSFMKDGVNIWATQTWAEISLVLAPSTKGLLYSLLQYINGPTLFENPFKKLTTQNSQHINALAWSHDSTYLAVGTDNGNIEIWNTINREAHWRRERIFRRALNSITSLAFSPGSDSIASAYLMPFIDIWKISDGQKVQELDTITPVNSLTWDKTAGQLVTFHRDNMVKTWDMYSH